MRTTSKVLIVAVALCMLAAVGCQKKMQLTIINHTADVLPVVITTPDDGSVNAGSVQGNGSALTYTVRINIDSLPAPCTVKVGMVGRGFTVNQDMREKQWFHYTDKGLAGPTDKKTTTTVLEQTGDVKLKVSGGTVVE